MAAKQGDAPTCQVCYSDLTHPCILPCSHDGICATCHLRLRHLHGDKKCPMCKQENQQLIVDQLEDAKPFGDYPLWGNELGAEFTFRDGVGMFFPIQYYETEILPLFGYNCGVCPNYHGVEENPSVDDAKTKNQNGKSNLNKKGTPFRGLQDHLRNKHRLTLCQLCVEFKRDFVARLPRFTPTQLKGHLSKGDGVESGFSGHPLCKFCHPKRFYDLTQLHMHLQKDHYKCHVCDKQGMSNQYFKDYSALAKHFEKQHFLCGDPQCLAARFVVFENEIDLRAHERDIHGATSASTKIQLEFRVRREGYDGGGYDNNQQVPSDQDFQFGLGGEAFVPEALPQPDEPNAETSHPLHFARTAQLRAQAAEIRAAQNLDDAADHFPSLGSNQEGSSDANLRVGWTSGTIRGARAAANSVNEFPSLPTSQRNKNNVSAKLRSGGTNGNRQFMAIRNAASAPASSQTNPSWAASAASPSDEPLHATSSAMVTGVGNRQGDLTSANFPALGGSSAARASYPVNNFPPLGGGGSGRSAASTSFGPKKGNVGAARKPDLSSANFPSLGSASHTRAAYPVNAHNVRQDSSSVYNRAPVLGQPGVSQSRQHSNVLQVPPTYNATEFPGPPKASGKGQKVRDKVLGNRNNSSSQQHSMQQGMATVGEMKAVLGPKYKELRNLTKDFSVDGLSPEAFVDHAASLFPGGYRDDDFCSFVPSLLLSCPNQTSAASALRYMEDMRSALFQSQIPPSPTSWSASAPVTNVASGPTTAPYAAQAKQPAIATHRNVVTARGPVRAGGSVQTKSSSSWAAKGGASTVTRAKAGPTSVSVAAANQTAQSGTATKYMAKEQKAKNNSSQQGQAGGGGSKGKKKNKGKQNNELRALAFGK